MTAIWFRRSRFQASAQRDTGFTYWLNSFTASLLVQCGHRGSYLYEMRGSSKPYMMSTTRFAMIRISEYTITSPMMRV